MSKLINRIESLNLKYENTTLSVGLANCGTKVNIVPHSASIVFDIRSYSQENVEKVLTEIKNMISYLLDRYKDSTIILKNNLKILPLVKNNNVITNQLISNFNLTENEFIGGCEAGYFASLGGESIIFGAGDISLAHKPNEFLDLNKFEIYNNLFLKIIYKIKSIIKENNNEN